MLALYALMGISRRGHSREAQHFADDAAARLTLDMDDEVDGFCDLGFGVDEGAFARDCA